MSALNQAANASRYAFFRGLTPKALALALDAFYECPRRREGDGTITWLGPLAGYTSRGKDGLQRLGPEYLNFSMIARDHMALRVVAEKLLYASLGAIQPTEKDMAFCGIPTGGRSIVEMMREVSSVRCIWPEQEEIGQGSAGRRAEKRWRFAPEMEPRPGEHVVLVEDVGNAFSTTEVLVDLVEAFSARVVVIALFLNRSPTIERSFSHRGRNIPISALWREAMPLYDQSDPEVEIAVASGNFHLETKKRWDDFLFAMRPQR